VIPSERKKKEKLCYCLELKRHANVQASIHVCLHTLAGLYLAVLWNVGVGDCKLLYAPTDFACKQTEGTAGASLHTYTQANQCGTGKICLRDEGTADIRRAHTACVYAHARTHTFQRTHLAPQSGWLLIETSEIKPLAATNFCYMIDAA
jgi:hypothetical protein